MLKNTNDAKIPKIELAGVFVAIGSELNSSQWRGLLSSDKEDYIIINELTEPKIPRILLLDMELILPYWQKDSCHFEQALGALSAWEGFYEGCFVRRSTG